MSPTLYKILIGVFSLASLGTMGCQKSAPQPGSRAAGEIGYGTLADHTYTNDYFGLSVTFPEQWYIQSREDLDELSKSGANLAAGPGADKTLKAAIQAGQPNTLNLVSAFRHPPGTPGSFNPSIILAAERVKHLPGIRTGAEYCENLKRTLGMTAIKYEFDPVEGNHKIGEIGRASCRERVYVLV